MTPDTKVRITTERARALLNDHGGRGLTTEARETVAHARFKLDACSPELAADLVDAREEFARMRDNLDATSHALDDARARLDDVADAFDLPREWDGEWGDRVRALLAAGGAPALSRVRIARACRDTAARITARMERALDGPTTHERAGASVWSEVANLIESGREAEYLDEEGDAPRDPTGLDLDATSHALDDLPVAFGSPPAWDEAWADRVRALAAAGGPPALPPWRSEPPTRAEFDATPEAAEGRHARLILTRTTDEPEPRLGFFVWLKDNGLCALDTYGDEYSVSGWDGLGYEYVLCSPLGVPLPWPVVPAAGGSAP